MDVAAKLLGQEVDNYAVGGSNGNTAGRITVNPPFAYVSEPTPVTSRSLVQQVRPGPFEMHWTLCPVQRTEFHGRETVISSLSFLNRL